MKTIPRRHFEEWYTKEYRSDAEKPLFGALRGELKRFLQELPLAGGKALDIGCGDGRNAIALARQGFEVTGVDQIPGEILQSKAAANDVEIAYWQGDILAYEPPGKFDVVVCSEVLHLFEREEIERVLRKAIAATKPGGYVFFDILADVNRKLVKTGEPFTWDVEAGLSIAESKAMFEGLFRDWRVLFVDEFFDKQTWPLSATPDLPIPSYTWQGTYVSCAAMNR